MFEVHTRDWIIKLAPESHPDELVIEISAVCNLKCVHCFRRVAVDLKPHQMDLNLFKNLIIEASEIGVKKIVFSGWGEPLIHPNIDLMIKFCKMLKLDTALNTNGILLSDFINIIVDYVDELYISLDIAKVRIFNSLIHSLEEITKVKQLRGTLKPRVIALYTITRLNIDDVELFLELARSLGINGVMFSFSIPFDEDNIGCLNSVECVNYFYLKIREAMDKLKELGLSISIPSKPYTPNVKCPFVASRALFIRSDGAITPCIYYAYSWVSKIFGVKRRLKAITLGYIGKDKIINVWREKYAKIFYRLNLRKSIPSCFACTLVEYCVKTRSNEVDCLGGEPNCGHCPFYHGLTFCPL